jgi:hypothetical protein
MTPKEFEQFRNNAKRIVGYMPIKIACVTCQIPDDQIPKTSKLPSKKCLIRQCVDKAGISNCAYCSRFPCDTLKETAGLWNRQSIEKKLGMSISEKDYHSFVEPFEGLNRLEVIHASLKQEDIIEPVKLPRSETRIVDFPENILIKENLMDFKKVHKLLVDLDHSSLGLSDTDTFAQHHKLEKHKAHVLRFLWIFGNYGKLDTKGTSLVVDSETYQDNRGKEKTLSIWSFVKDVVFKPLAEFGVRCDRVTLEGFRIEDLTTGTGYLRKHGWVMSISFDEKIGGSDALKALQTYAKRLYKRHGSRAFNHFRNADMKVLSACAKQF